MDNNKLPKPVKNVYKIEYIDESTPPLYVIAINFEEAIKKAFSGRSIPDAEATVGSISLICSIDIE